MQRSHYAHESLLRASVWGGLLVMVLFDWLFLKILGIELTYGKALLVVLSAVAYALFAYAFLRQATILQASNGACKTVTIFRSLGHFFEGLCQFMLFMLAGAILSYIAAASPLPLYDAQLMMMDQMLGFNWLSYIAWVNQTPYVNGVLEMAYNSYFQVPCLFLLLAFTGNAIRIYQVMLCCVISLAACMAIAAMFPALSPYTFLGVDASQFPNVNMISGYWHIHDLSGMREGTLKELEFLNLKGIITFPSFHAALAVIFAWGFWPVVWARIPFLALNLLMLLSVPATGGHYVADVVGGVVVTVVVIMCIHWMSGRMGAAPCLNRD